MLAVDWSVNVCALAMPVIDGDECRDFLPISASAALPTAEAACSSLLASVLQDASYRSSKLHDAALFARPRRIKDQGESALYFLGVNGPRQSTEKGSAEGGKC